MGARALPIPDLGFKTSPGSMWRVKGSTWEQGDTRKSCNKSSDKKCNGSSGGDDGYILKVGRADFAAGLVVGVRANEESGMTPGS